MANKLPNQYEIEQHRGEDFQCVRYNFLNSLNSLYGLKLKSQDFEVEQIPSEIGIPQNNTLEEGIMNYAKTLNRNGLVGKVTAFLSSSFNDISKFTENENADLAGFNDYKKQRQSELIDLDVDIRDSLNMKSQEVYNIIKDKVSLGNRVVIGVNMGPFFREEEGFQKYFPKIYDESKEGIEKGYFDYTHTISLVGYESDKKRFIFEETIAESPAKIMYMDENILYKAATTVYGNEENIEAVILEK